MSHAAMASDTDDNDSIDSTAGHGERNADGDAGQEAEVQDKAQAEWQAKGLEYQLKDVMNLLRSKQRVWNDDSHALGSAVTPLEQYKKITLLDERHGESMRATALHMMAITFESEDYRYDEIPADIIEPVIRDMLTSIYEKPGSAVEWQVKGRMPEPIWAAIRLGKSDKFIDRIKAAGPEHFPKLLEEQDTEGKNALHHLFALPLVKTTAELNEAVQTVTKRASDLLPLVSHTAIAAQDKEGNTPVHYAANFRQCRDKDDQYVNLFKDMVAKGDKLMKGDKAFNKKDESPLLYGQRTRRKFEARLKRKKQQSAAASTPNLEPAASSSKVPESPREGSAPWKDLKGGSRFTTKPGSANGTVHGNDLQLNKNKIPGGLDGPGSRRMSIADGPKDSLKRVDSFRKMPPPPLPAPQKLTDDGAKASSGDLKILAPDQGKTANVGAAERSPNAAYDEIQEFLTLYYISCRPDMEARDLIFGKDASGMFHSLDRWRRSTPSGELITRPRAPADG